MAPGKFAIFVRSVDIVPAVEIRAVEEELTVAKASAAEAPAPATLAAVAPARAAAPPATVLNAEKSPETKNRKKKVRKFTPILGGGGAIFKIIPPSMRHAFEVHGTHCDLINIRNTIHLKILCPF